MAGAGEGPWLGAREYRWLGAPPPGSRGTSVGRGCLGAQPPSRAWGCPGLRSGAGVAGDGWVPGTDLAVLATPHQAGASQAGFAGHLGWVPSPLAAAVPGCLGHAELGADGVIFTLSPGRLPSPTGAPQHLHGTLPAALSRSIAGTVPPITAAAPFLHPLSPGCWSWWQAPAGSAVPGEPQGPDCHLEAGAGAQSAWC